MNVRAVSMPVLAAGFCGLVLMGVPGLCVGADSTGTQTAVSSVATSASKTAGAPPVEEGGIGNNFISYKEEPTACFNHEASGGKFTLATTERGAIAQLFYAVTYDGKRAAYRHEADEAPQADGFDEKTSHSVSGGKIVTEARSYDGAISVRTESACGKGPYVTRQMKVTNTGKKRLAEVKLLLTVNPDTLDWNNETGEVAADGAQVLVHNASNTQWVGVGAQPKPDFLTADDVMSLLDAEAGWNWSEPSKSYTGNVAVQVGWKVGPLEPGQSKTVEATLANTGSEKDLKKALGRGTF